MSPRDKFDRYMVAFGAAKHIKFRRLNTMERHAFFMGVLSIAGQAPVRGCLLVGSLPAEAEDIAQESDVHVKFCRSALEKLRAVGVIYTDDELGCERVHDFEDWNPEPRKDNTSAERQARYREKLRGEGRSRSIPSNVKDAVIARDKGVCVACGSADRIEFHHRQPVAQGGDNTVSNVELRCFDCHRGHAGHAVTGDVTSRVTHALAHEEVEVEVKPPTPFAVDFEEWVLHYEQTTGHALPARTTKAFKGTAESYGARRTEGYSADDMKLATVGAHSDEWRRSQGYDTAESILRPKKIAALIAQGKLRTGGAQRPLSSVELAAKLNGGAA